MNLQAEFIGNNCDVHSCILIAMLRPLCYVKTLTYQLLNQLFLVLVAFDSVLQGFNGEAAYLRIVLYKTSSLA